MVSLTETLEANAAPCTSDTALAFATSACSPTWNQNTFLKIDQRNHLRSEPFKALSKQKDSGCTEHEQPGRFSQRPMVKQDNINPEHLQRP